ncbi:tetratricopeptide repeat protein, partial [Cyanobacterium aponinum FACHB-4101]|uniref:tetratricopeptide repeat protein n=1 Tax=Cyanobacterium aponinum TaxID=379064 RepID=UPI00168169DF
PNFEGIVNSIYFLRKLIFVSLLIVLQFFLSLNYSWYSKAIESNPKNINAYIGRGYVNIELKNYDLANQDLDKAIQINPNSSNVYHIKGLLEDDKNNLLDAIALYNQAIELNSENSEEMARIFNDRGVAYSKLSLTEKEEDAREYNQKALKDFNQAILLDNNYGLAYYNRGLLYKQLGYLDEAKLDLEKAIRLLNKIGDKTNYQKSYEELK